MAKSDHEEESSGDVPRVNWGYDLENGPDRWSSLNPDWALCASGLAQSPIDFPVTEDEFDPNQFALDLPEVSLHVGLKKSVLEVFNNGHTIQVNVDAVGTLMVGREKFKLRQYHFHAPSDHTVGGEIYPMELHLVHKSKAEELAVIGVFIQEGAHNSAFDAVWDNMPVDPGTRTRTKPVRLHIEQMLPSETKSWRYKGSLTTPPCTEMVHWIVLKTPVQLDSAQIRQFSSLFSGNSRPTQPLNGRSIITDSLKLADDTRA